MRLLLAALVLLFPLPAFADAVVAARTIRAKVPLSADDVQLVPDTIPGAVTSLDQVIGFEARQTIFAGRPIAGHHLVAAAAVERNELVEMVYDTGGLTITTEGRALGRGAEGARIRVMNLASRTTVTATIVAHGRVSVP